MRRWLVQVSPQLTAVATVVVPFDRNKTNTKTPKQPRVFATEKLALPLASSCATNTVKEYNQRRTPQAHTRFSQIGQ